MLLIESLGFVCVTSGENIPSEGFKQAGVGTQGVCECTDPPSRMKI